MRRSTGDPSCSMGHKVKGPASCSWGSTTPSSTTSSCQGRWEREKVWLESIIKIYFYLVKIGSPNISNGEGVHPLLVRPRAISCSLYFADRHHMANLSESLNTRMPTSRWIILELCYQVVTRGMTYRAKSEGVYWYWTKDVQPKTHWWTCRKMGVKHISLFYLSHLHTNQPMTSSVAGFCNLPIYFSVWMYSRFKEFT